MFATGILVQRLEVHSSAADACAIGYSGLVRDLLCVSSAAGGVALEDSWGGGTGALTLRNVTAIATGPGSYGIRANSTGNDTNLDISARNVIASGVLADIGSGETGTNSESDVILSYSNYDKIEELGGGNVSNVGSVSTNQTALPIFLDTTLYHQAQTSPTVDKGATDVSVGTADLDGDPRRLGAATDIGADEYDTIAAGRRVRARAQAEDAQAQGEVHLRRDRGRRRSPARWTRRRPSRATRRSRSRSSGTASTRSRSRRVTWSGTWTRRPRPTAGS